MTHREIEPWAAKTLLFLRSSGENSLEEMRTMLMEVIGQKYHGSYKIIPPLSGLRSDSNEKTKSKESKSSSSDHKSKSHSSGGFSPSINLTSPDSYVSDSDSSSDNSEMVILEDDLPACTICKEMTCTGWNQFVECAECHSLYHQQCHNPPIPDSDVNDPRNVWYCRNCTKTVSKPKTSSVSSSSTSSQSSKNSSSKLSSGRSNTASPSFGSKPFGGVSMSNSKKSSSSKNSQSSSNKVAPNLVAVDKRLQIMKKKAAKKQEKRPK